MKQCKDIKLGVICSSFRALIYEKMSFDRQCNIIAISLQLHAKKTVELTNGRRNLDARLTFHCIFIHDILHPQDSLSVSKNWKSQCSYLLGTSRLEGGGGAQGWTDS